MTRRWIAERTAFKVLLEPQGAIFALTMRTYSYLFFVTRPLIGWRKIRTKDFIVARAGYSAPGTVRLIGELYPEGL